MSIPPAREGQSVVPNSILGPIHNGSAFIVLSEVPCRFVKDVLPIGSKYRGTGPSGEPWELDVTPELGAAIIASFDAMRRAGHRIPAPENHFGRNHGFWKRLYLARNMGSGDQPQWAPDPSGTHIVGELEVTIDESDVGSGLQEVSIGLEPSYTDGQGRTFAYAPLHIAPCTKPVVPGQTNFTRIAACGAPHIIPMRAAANEMSALIRAMSAPPTCWGQSL